MREQKWIVLDADGWKVVIPETDIRPHSTETDGTEREIAFSECPCKPKVSYQDLMIVHNSFEDEEAIDKQMEDLGLSKDK
jgi:hypothetical protein